MWFPALISGAAREYVRCVESRSAEPVSIRRTGPMAGLLVGLVAGLVLLSWLVAGAAPAQEDSEDNVLFDNRYCMGCHRRRI